MRGFVALVLLVALGGCGLLDTSCSAGGDCPEEIAPAALTMADASGKWKKLPADGDDEERHSGVLYAAFSSRDRWKFDGVTAVHSLGTKKTTHVLATRDNAYVTAVAALAPDDLWVGGAYILQHWDGRKWTSHPGPSISDFSATGTDDIWALTHDRATPLRHWDGTAWRPVPLPPVPLPRGYEADFGPRSVVALVPNDVWVIGTVSSHRFADFFDHHSVVALHYDGTGWTNRAPALAGTEFTSAAPDGTGGFWVGTNRPAVLRYSDGTWTKHTFASGDYSAEIQRTGSGPVAAVADLSQPGSIPPPRFQWTP